MYRDLRTIKFNTSAAEEPAGFIHGEATRDPHVRVGPSIVFRLLAPICGISILEEIMVVTNSL